MEPVPGPVSALKPTPVKDPSLPATVPIATTSEPSEDVNRFKERREGFRKFVYNKETKEYCGRTCQSWLYMVCYTIMYLLFLSTYTLLFLYISLYLIKHMVDFKNIDKIELLTYSENGIGLSAVPTSTSNFPVISYSVGDAEDYKKYVTSLDNFLSSRRKKRDLTNLGPCGKPPYGYGTQPCVILKINKLLFWAAMPLQKNSTATKSAPSKVLNWMKTDKDKYWLHCSGGNDYDKEHIRSIKYYPDPPGFDSKAFPLDEERESPLVAVQLSEFTLGMSLTIECKLWYDTGPSSIEFLLFVKPVNVKESSQELK